MKCTGCAVINNQAGWPISSASGWQIPIYKRTPNQQMTVEDTIRFVDVRASGKRSAVAMSTPATTNTSNEEVDQVDAIPSGYKKQQRPVSKATPPKYTHPQTPARNQGTPNKWQQPPQKPPSQLANPKARCGFCGTQGHGERQ